MKRIHYVGIIIILLVLVGLFIISPFSQLNKTSLDGHSVKLPNGYVVQNSSSTQLTISNGTNNLTLYSSKSNSTENAIKQYHDKYDEKYNITQKEIKMDNGEKVTKTTAKSYNETITIYKYWFVKDKKVYNIQTDNPVKGTEDHIKSMISSF